MEKTTIQIKRRNLSLLDAMKKRTGAKSYDEVIERILQEELKIPADLFGVDRGRITKFREEDRLEDRD